jgi:hypothetical protein
VSIVAGEALTLSQVIQKVNSHTSGLDHRDDGFLLKL